MRTINLFRNINLNQTNEINSREDRPAWGNPSFEEEFYFGSAEQEELLNALISDVSNTAIEHRLEIEQIMILLSVDAYEILSRGRGGYFERIYGADVHVVDDQIDLYKVVVKGYRGFYIAERKVRVLREKGL